MMVLKLGKTAPYIALERSLDRALSSATILQGASQVDKPTAESHGALFADIEEDIAKATKVLEDIRSEMQIPKPRVPGVLLGVHKDEGQKNRFTVLSYIREGDVDSMTAAELIETYEDTGAYKKVWFQPTTIPEK